ncbi:tRNA (guanosine(37)-N1)-methyltransferase TrmD [Proteiniborus sp. MB09-C3]|uniref:tRNA (guanosine(37)-N1)-methyltransferase TrmD n=1 Tax=Proteiniborus sp. MB09-C3 TaxID=3050072 RepID=UPI002552241F|nr:tRNA (guanosine(37)-N1)-methyltransferase TrmD [Proteiniborus sp. MB09-C3]WIV10840.1 tRNA (guanosine(37)-N1)-methyltransferase TrmD [Proteiniborus sp. MB09-C3]
MRIDVLTLFPEMFFNFLDASIVGRAVNSNIARINCIDIRDFSKDKHRRVDDYPFGGGPGMVMGPEPIYNAINSVKSEKSRIICLSPKGRTYNQEIANKLSLEEHIVLLCGHYEGIDNRVIENYIDDEISIGDYVLTGGEIAAMAVIDSIIRLLPGVLNNQESYMDESYFNGLLEYPHYTRPRIFNGIEVPEVLLSGNHEKINQWRKYQSLKITYERRPDLLANIELDKNEQKMLEDIIKKDSNCEKIKAKNKL